MVRASHKSHVISFVCVKIDVSGAKVSSTRIVAADFPQDKQQVSVKLESPLFNNGYIRYQALPGVSKLLVPSKMTVVEWCVQRPQSWHLMKLYVQDNADDFLDVQ